MRRCDSRIRQTAKKSPTVSPGRPISITPVGAGVRSAYRQPRSTPMFAGMTIARFRAKSSR
jgi:hypothetical protein